jgi:osmotically-inducible protein OsmY
MNRFARLFCAGLCLATLSSCIFMERRTAGSYVDDGNIETKIRTYVQTDNAVRPDTHISTVSYNGIVLLTGEVPNAKVRQLVVDYAKQTAGVNKVVDEMRIAGTAGFGSRTNDTWITTKVKSSLFGKTGFDVDRIKVLTESSVVYLMGIVTKEEAERAVAITRQIDGVSRVVKVFEFQN